MAYITLLQQLTFSFFSPFYVTILFLFIYLLSFLLFYFWLDTLCSELDQERKARYAIQQKLKGNFIWSQKQNKTKRKLIHANYFAYKHTVNMQVLLLKKIK